MRLQITFNGKVYILLRNFHLIDDKSLWSIVCRLTPLLLYAGWPGNGVLALIYHILTAQTPQNVRQRGHGGAHGGRGEFRKLTLLAGNISLAGEAENRAGKFAGKK